MDGSETGQRGKQGGFMWWEHKKHSQEILGKISWTRNLVFGSAEICKTGNQKRRNLLLWLVGNQTKQALRQNRRRVYRNLLKLNFLQKSVKGYQKSDKAKLDKKILPGSLWQEILSMLPRYFLSWSLSGRLDLCSFLHRKITMVT